MAVSIKEYEPIAFEIKKDNLPVEQIAKFTKLAVEEIENL